MRLWYAYACAVFGAAGTTALIDRPQPLRQPSRGRHAASKYSPSMVATSVPAETVYTLVVVRHGQSTWNRANRFIGWTDTALTEEGLLEAQIAGKILRKENFNFDVCYTSYLKRAIKTAWLVLDELNQHYVEVVSDWRLNERCYGALVSKYKKECVKEYGKDQVKLWRRSYDTPPPPIHESSMFWPGNDHKYDFIPREELPRCESLKDTSKRSLSCWDQLIKPSIREGKRVLLCGHENNLRSILKHLDGVADEDIVHVELPRAIPLVYFLDKDMKPLPQEGSAPYLNGRYLGDPDEVNIIMERDVKQVYDLSVTENLEESGPKYGDVSLNIRDCQELGQCEIAGYFGLDPATLTNLRAKLKVATSECRFGDFASTGARARHTYLAYTNGVQVDNWEEAICCTDWSHGESMSGHAQSSTVPVKTGVKPSLAEAGLESGYGAANFNRSPSLSVPGTRGVDMRTHAHTNTHTDTDTHTNAQPMEDGLGLGLTK